MLSIMTITLVGAVGFTLVLTLIHTLLFIQNKENYLRSWMVAWIAMLLCYISFFGLTLSQSFTILFSIFSCIAGYFLLLASYQLIQRDMPRCWPWAAAACARGWSSLRP